MNKHDKKKPVSERLTDREREALVQNAKGNSLYLVRCIFDKVKAIDKITAMGAMGATSWANASAAHHIEVRDYLFAQLREGEIRQQVYDTIFAE